MNSFFTYIMPILANMVDRSVTYYKFINRSDIHPYKIGINYASECGEMYFNSIVNIFEFAHEGDTLCTIKIPSAAQVTRPIYMYGWKPPTKRLICDQLIIESMDKVSLDLIKRLLRSAGDIPGHKNKLLKWAAPSGQLDVVKYLIDNVATIFNSVLITAAKYGRDIVN